MKRACWSLKNFKKNLLIIEQLKKTNMNRTKGSNFWMTLVVAFIFPLLISACSGSKKQGQDVASGKGLVKNNKDLPNVIIIYADDLGYGDLSCYGATELHTPNIDKLANAGLRFNDAHAASATCTPSRYSLLTGSYPFRNSGAEILAGSDPLIIGTSQLTMPKVFKSKNYHTSIIGKWHLGLGDGEPDWNNIVTPGPNEVGFDYSYIMAATQDRVPTVYINNGKVVNLDPADPIRVSYDKKIVGDYPDAIESPESMVMRFHHHHNNSVINGIPRIGWMTGGKSAIWNDQEMANVFLKEANAYVKKHKNERFFLYYALQQPHVPRTPHPDFVGKSGMGPRGDVILEADWLVGEFMNTLEKEGLLENTIVIFSSDNGPIIQDGYYDDAVEKLGNHKPGGVFRGTKYSLFEAGTRVPFLVQWKGHIAPGVSDKLFSQIDLLASFAALLGLEGDYVDSQNMLGALMGKSDAKSRSNLILEATGRTALRKGNWVMIPPSKSNPGWIKPKSVEIGSSEEYQLYDLISDPGQTKNMAKDKPEVLEDMKKDYQAIMKK
jgi:arylsulfatase A-like enzyme